MHKRFLPLLLLPLALQAIDFKHLSMEQAISMALDRNPAVKIADAKVTDAQHSVYQALGSALPSVSLQGSRILDEKVQVI